MQPRFLFRRFFAFFIDYTVAFLLTAVLLLAFLAPDETKLRLGNGPISITKCANVTSLGQDFHDLVAPDPINSAQLCENRPFGIYNGRQVSMVFALKQTKDGAITKKSYKTATVSIDGDNQITQTIAPQGLMILLLLIIGGAVLLARGRRTPGKVLLGLRIAGDGCAMCREVRRLGPFLAFSLLAFGVDLVPAGGFVKAFARTPVLGMAFLAGVIALAVFWYYVWPFIRWKGVARWDAATGFEVTRA